MFANDECGKAAKSIDLVSDPGTLPAVPSIVADEEPVRVRNRAGRRNSRGYGESVMIELRDAAACAGKDRGRIGLGPGPARPGERLSSSCPDGRCAPSWIPAGGRHSLREIRGRPHARGPEALSRLTLGTFALPILHFRLSVALSPFLPGACVVIPSLFDSSPSTTSANDAHNSDCTEQRSSPIRTGDPFAALLPPCGGRGRAEARQRRRRRIDRRVHGRFVRAHRRKASGEAEPVAPANRSWPKSRPRPRSLLSPPRPGNGSCPSSRARKILSRNSIYRPCASWRIRTPTWRSTTITPPAQVGNRTPRGARLGRLVSGFLLTAISKRMPMTTFRGSSACRGDRLGSGLRQAPCYPSLARLPTTCRLRRNRALASVAAPWDCDSRACHDLHAPVRRPLRS